MKYEIGDKVFLKKGIPLYLSSNASKPNGYNDKDRITVITRKVPNTKHPYNTTGDLGWCDESSLKLYEDEKKYECEIELTDKNGLIDYLKKHDDKIIMIDSKQLKDILGL